MEEGRKGRTSKAVWYGVRGVSLEQGMEAKEIRKCVEMEPGCALCPPSPAVLLTDGSKGGWVEGRGD